MKVLVTGATGFVGRHVVAELLKKCHQVTALARDEHKAKAMPWWGSVPFISADVHNVHDVSKLGTFDALVHLAWPGLPKYREIFHIEKNLLADYTFIKSMVQSGTTQVLVTGTCFEYGQQYGPLAEDGPTLPSTPYGLAKDSLRKFLQTLQIEIPFVLQWVRLFYMYGAGQNPVSLMAQLDQAIKNGEHVFNMSGGEQLRDYLPIEIVAHRLVALVEHPGCNGVMNCCKGKPTSIRNLVEQRIAEQRSEIAINLGHFPYPDYEPMAFWGLRGKLDALFESMEESSFDH